MFQIHKSGNGQYFWRLKAGNGETLCHSETYTTKQNAINGVNACRNIVPNASVQDNT